MENITAYDLAIIGGGFTIVGALISALVAYCMSIQLHAKETRTIAIANFRAAFTPCIAQMRFEQKYGRTTEVDRILTEQFISMSVAIETFRPFISCKSSESYQQAWDNYSPFVSIAQFGQYSMRENGEDANAPFVRFFNNINAILNHAQP